ncbi:MAG: ribonuclease H-like domain-containing protein, partial [Dehalococcoidia bacterium]|nr:ribonuclease H-like domain-containing protein [Dehalococcoidia bacterium]
EAALLEALVEDVHASIPRPILVTYNGRTFDAPMLDARATMHRRRFGFDSLPHVDVLPPARTLYRGWLPRCRLLDVESRILGVTRPSADVDGAEVPAWYFRYLRSGDMRFVEPIASHNLLDVLSLAALTGRIAALVRGDEEPLGAEALGTARLLSRRAPDRAIALLEAVAPRDVPRRADLVWLLAALLKRQGLHDRAVPLWQELADSPGPWSVRALEELAKFCEHRSRDLAGAMEHVDQALTRIASDASRLDADDRAVAAFHHRRQRLTWRLDRESRSA